MRIKNINDNEELIFEGADEDECKIQFAYRLVACGAASNMDEAFNKLTKDIDYIVVD